MKRMKRFIHGRSSAAMIVAVIALVVAIGGTAVAGPGFVSFKKYKAFKRNTNAFKTVAVKGPLTYATQEISIPPTPAGSGGTGVAAPCPLGSDPTGGGIKVANNLAQDVVDSHPTVGGWAGTVHNSGPAAHNAVITAICVQSLTAGIRPAN